MKIYTFELAFRGLAWNVPCLWLGTLGASIMQVISSLVSRWCISAFQLCEQNWVLPYVQAVNWVAPWVELPFPAFVSHGLFGQMTSWTLKCLLPSSAMHSPTCCRETELVLTPLPCCTGLETRDVTSGPSMVLPYKPWAFQYIVTGQYYPVRRPQ